MTQPKQGGMLDRERCDRNMVWIRALRMVQNLLIFWQFRPKARLRYDVQHVPLNNQRSFEWYSREIDIRVVEKNGLYENFSPVVFLGFALQIHEMSRTRMTLRIRRHSWELKIDKLASTFWHRMECVAQTGLDCCGSESPFATAWEA